MGCARKGSSHRAHKADDADRDSCAHRMHPQTVSTETGTLAEDLADDPSEAPQDQQDDAIAIYASLAMELGGSVPEAPTPGPGLSYALIARVDLGLDVKQALLEDRDEVRRIAVVTSLLHEIHRGLVLTRKTQERARRNGRVRTPEELAAELGLTD